MSRIIKKYIGNDQVGSNQILLENNLALRANDSSAVSRDIFVFDAVDTLQFVEMINLPRIAINPTEAVRLDQLQASLEGLSTKEPARVATTSNITLSGLQTIDGITVADGDRVLVKNQTNPAENGIYNASPGIWTRTTDTNTATEIQNAYVAIQEGTDNAGRLYVQSGLVSTINVDPVNFIFFNSVASLSGGDGITVSSNIVSVDLKPAGGLSFDAGQLQVDITSLAGFGLEDDGTGLLRVASVIAGDGLSGGSGSPIVVEPQLASSPNVAAAINVTPTGVGVKVDDITINANASGQLQVLSVPASALDATVAGEGLSLNGTTNAIDVNVDDTTIEIASDILQIKDLGISGSKLAPSTIDATKLTASVFGEGLIQNGTAIDVNVDDVTIEIVADTLQVKDAGISEAKLAPDIDAQTFEVTYSPLNFTPVAVGTEPTTRISAYLRGLDTAIGSITTSLDGLTDVTLTAPQDGDLLQYNNSTSQWENVALDTITSEGVCEVFTLTATDITNGYVDLTNSAAFITSFVVQGSPKQFNQDLTLSGSPTRVTWSASIASLLSAGNLVEICYITIAGSVSPSSNDFLTSGTFNTTTGDLTLNVSNQPLVIINLDGKYLESGDNISQLTNDANYIDSAGAPVQSVNTQTGVVVLSANDIQADHAPTNYTALSTDTIEQHLAAIDSELATAGAVTSVNGETGAVIITANEIDSTYTPTNYTQSNATIDGHLDGINTELGKIVENPFELQDIVSFTGNSDLLLTWANDYVRCTSASNVTVTVQPEATIAHTAKTVITIRQAAAGQVTLVAGSGVTLNVRAAEGLKTAEQHAEIQLTYIGSNVWDIKGGVA